eukprot:s2645_g3.t1
MANCRLIVSFKQQWNDGALVPTCEMSIGASTSVADLLLSPRFTHNPSTGSMRKLRTAFIFWSPGLAASVSWTIDENGINVQCSFTTATCVWLHILDDSSVLTESERAEAKAGLARLLERLSWDRQRWSTEDTKLVKEVATLLRSEYPELLQSNWVPRSVVTTIDLIR